MGILDLADLDSLPSRTGGSICRVAAVVQQHPDDADTILTAVNDRLDIPASTVSMWFDRHGIKISVSSIRRHRRHECACQHG